MPDKHFDVDDLATTLAESPGIRIRREEPLRAHCTFRVGGPADLFVEVDSVAGLRTMRAACRAYDTPFHLLGLGSNVLFPDEGLRGFTVRLAGDFRRIETRHFETGGARVTAGAAVSLAKLARETASSGLVGLEALSGFPSTVGGAVFMNAGCYGTEISDVLETAEILGPDGSLRTVGAADLEPRYRETNLKGSGGIVTSAVFALTEGSSETAMARLDELNRKRWKSLPSGKPNVGSIFKNPDNDSAGRLIDQCGLKGETCGGARISEKHGNVIVNTGGARADDVLELMLRAYRAVETRFDVRLEPEVVLCGSLRAGWNRATASGESAPPRRDARA